MKKILIICLFLPLFGCDTASWILFHDVSSYPVKVPDEKTMNPMPPVMDFYGRPIYVITYDNKKTIYGQGLYHALNQSLQRYPNQFFLIIGFYAKDNQNQIEKDTYKLRQEMINLGIEESKIVTRTEEKTKSERFETIKLYER